MPGAHAPARYCNEETSMHLTLWIVCVLAGALALAHINANGWGWVASHRLWRWWRRPCCT